MANGKGISIFDPAQRPAHVKAAQEAGTTNIVTRSQVNTLTFAGKVWTVTKDGTKKSLMDEEGNAIQALEAVIIAYNENKGRSYYGGRAYDPGQESAPVCWSNDGITSSPNSTERQSEKCNVCPQAIKGSRQTDQGKAAMACSVHRNLAIVPVKRDLGSAPLLRLKIPQTSDFDGLNKEAQAKGLYAFQNYLSHLKNQEVPFTYSLTTKIRFDNTKSFPKLWFSAGRWLNEDETTACAEIAASSNLDEMLRTDFSGFGSTQARPPGVTQEDEAEEDEEIVLAPPPAAAKPKAAAPKPAPEPEPEADDELTPALAPAPPQPSAKAKAANKKAEAAAAAAAARKSAALEEDDDEPVVSKAPKAVAAPPALDKILTDWDAD